MKTTRLLGSSLAGVFACVATAFGAMDVTENTTLSAANYSAEAMVSAIHKALPNTSVLLVPPMVPNPEAARVPKISCRPAAR